MGCVRCSGAVLSACRTISATALVAWAAGICEGGLRLYCTLPPIIVRRMPIAWHSYAEGDKKTIDP